MRIAVASFEANKFTSSKSIERNNFNVVRALALETASCRLVEMTLVVALLTSALRSHCLVLRLNIWNLSLVMSSVE